MGIYLRHGACSNYHRRIQRDCRTAATADHRSPLPPRRMGRRRAGRHPGYSAARRVEASWRAAKSWLGLGHATRSATPLSARSQGAETRARLVQEIRTTLEPPARPHQAACRSAGEELAWLVKLTQNREVITNDYPNRGTSRRQCLRDSTGSSSRRAD